MIINSWVAMTGGRYTRLIIKQAVKLSTVQPNLPAHTIEKQREYVREWKRMNPLRCRAHTASYYQRNKDKILAKQRAKRKSKS